MDNEYIPKEEDCDKEEIADTKTRKKYPAAMKEAIWKALQQLKDAIAKVARDSNVNQATDKRIMEIGKPGTPEAVSDFTDWCKYNTKLHTFTGIDLKNQLKVLHIKQRGTVQDFAHNL
jgi:hypothetical protein